MKKNFLSEQSSTEISNIKIKILNTALSSGCFKDLKFSSVDDKPTFVDNDVVLKAVGATSGDIYYIYAEPKVLFNTVTKKKLKWDCPELENQLKKIDSNVTLDSETKKKESLPSEKLSEPNYTKNIENLKKALEIKKIDSKVCKDAILTFFDGYEKSKQKLKTLSGNDFDKVKEVVQMCSRQKSVWNKLPLVGDKLQKRLDIMKSLDGNDTIIGQFKILENKIINQLVRNQVRETKKMKDIKSINENLVKTRLKLVFESIEDFETLETKKKIKKGFRTLKEIHTIEKMELINENLSSLFRGLYGKSFENSVQTISEPLFNIIFTKISLEDTLKSKVLENISSKTSELISSMEDCTTFAKFLTDSITEEYVKHLDEEKSKNNSLVYSSLMDSVDDEIFRKNLNTRLENIVCVLYNKFTENAKNLMVRMSAL